MWYLEYSLKYFSESSQLCRAGSQDVSYPRMITFAFVLSEIFPLGSLSCRSMMVPYFYSPLEYLDDTVH